MALNANQVSVLNDLLKHFPELHRSGVDDVALGDVLLALQTGETSETTDLASTANGKGASLVGIEDASAVTTGATVEDALTELSKRSLGGFADLAAIKAITAGQRSNGALLEKLDDSSLWVFAAASVAAGDDVTVIAPTAGTGRWLLSSTAATALFGAAGTNTASKALVVNAAKSVDVLQATTSTSVGGTGVPGAAGVETKSTKTVTAFLDTAAKDLFTVTVPNAQHAAVIEVDALAILGAGGAVGAGESVKSSKFRVTLARTAGKNVVAAISADDGGAAAKVAGADDITSIVLTLVQTADGVGATNAFKIQATVTRSGAGATNHVVLASARIVNENAAGVTIA